jgi:hypothetical protein
MMLYLRICNFLRRGDFYMLSLFLKWQGNCNNYNSKVVSVNIAAFWVIEPFSLVEVYRRFRNAYCLRRRPSDGGSTNLWNVGLLRREYMTLYTRKTYSSTKFLVMLTYPKVVRSLKSNVFFNSCVSKDLRFVFFPWGKIQCFITKKKEKFLSYNLPTFWHFLKVD